MEVIKILHEDDLGLLLDLKFRDEKFTWITTDLTELMPRIEKLALIKSCAGFVQITSILNVSGFCNQLLKLHEAKMRSIHIATGDLSGLRNEASKLYDTYNKCVVLQKIDYDEAIRALLQRYPGLKKYLRVEISVNRKMIEEFLESYIESYAQKKLVGQAPLPLPSYLYKEIVARLNSPTFQEKNGKKYICIDSTGLKYFSHSILLLHSEGKIHLKDFKLEVLADVRSDGTTWSDGSKKFWRATIDNLMETKGIDSTGMIYVDVKDLGKHTIYQFPFGEPLQFTTTANDHVFFKELLSCYGNQLDNSKSSLSKDEKNSALNQLQTKLKKAKLFDSVHVFSKKEGGYLLVIAPASTMGVKLINTPIQAK